MNCSEAKFQDSCSFGANLRSFGCLGLGLSLPNAPSSGFYRGLLSVTRVLLGPLLTLKESLLGSYSGLTRALLGSYSGPFLFQSGHLLGSYSDPSFVVWRLDFFLKQRVFLFPEAELVRSEQRGC